MVTVDVYAREEDRQWYDVELMAVPRKGEVFTFWDLDSPGSMHWRVQEVSHYWGDNGHTEVHVYVTQETADFDVRACSPSKRFEVDYIEGEGDFPDWAESGEAALAVEDFLGGAYEDTGYVPRVDDELWIDLSDDMEGEGMILVVTRVATQNRHGRISFFVGVEAIELW